MNRYSVKVNRYPSRRTETYSIIDAKTGRTVPSLPAFVHRDAADAYATKLNGGH